MRYKILFWCILLSAVFLRLYYVFVSPYAKHSVSTTDICTIGLMAKHILEGEFPLFFYGQYYLGPLEAYVTALFFLIFGIKIEVIYFSTIFFSVLFMISIFFLGKMLMDKMTGLIAMIYAGFPPAFFFSESVIPAGYHIEVVLLGNLIFISAILAVRTKASFKKAGYYCIIGALAGIGVWTHYIILYYLVPVGVYLFIKERFLTFLKNGILTVLSGIVTSLPFWIFTFKYNFITFKFASVPSQEKIGYAGLFKTFFAYILSMLGTESWYSPVLIIIYVTAFLYFILRRAAFKGDEVLFTFFLVLIMGLYIFYRSIIGRTAFWYLIPIISFIPLCFGYFAGLLMRWNRYLGISITVFVISVNLWNSSKLIDFEKGLSDQKRDWYKEKITFLDKNRIYRIAGNDRLLRQLEFFSKEKIIGTAFEGGDYHPHEDIVDASDKPAYEICDSDWRPVLDNMCSSYRYENGLYFDFRPFPYVTQSITPFNWHAVSSRNSMHVKFAFDRNYETIWVTDRGKRAGDYFKLDLGRPYKICRIVMYSDSYPNGCLIEVSADGQNWEKVCDIDDVEPIFWSGPRIYWHYMWGRSEFIFKPIEARYIKLTNKKGDSINPWELKEIFVYEYIPTPKLEILVWGYTGDSAFSFRDYAKEINEITNFLISKDIGFVYADYWPSAKVKKLSGGKIGVLDPYNTWLPLYKNMDRRIFLGKDKAIITSSGDKAEVENILHEFKIGFRRKRFGKYVCYYFPDLDDRYKSVSFSMWIGTTFVKYSMKDYSEFLYEIGCYEEALNYYPNNFSAYLKLNRGESPKFMPKVQYPVIFKNGIKFLGYTIRNKKLIPGKTTRIEYFWEVPKEQKRQLSVFVHFMKGGEIVFQNDHNFLYQFKRPLNPLPRERFREVLKLKISPLIQPGVYKIVIGLWDKNTQKRICIKDSTGKRKTKAEIGEILIAK